MTERRPRIDAVLAEEVDAARGMVPFEPFVRSLIVRGLHSHPSDPEEALNHILWEHFAGDLKKFDAFVDGVRSKAVEAYDDAAIEQEFEEDD